MINKKLSCSKTAMLYSAAMMSLSAGPAFSQNSDLNIFDLSLSELLQVEVATKNEMSVLRAPAVVSSIDIDSMKRLGLRTLPEILSFLPGVNVNHSGFGNFPIQVRGLSDGVNQKVLFLLDGVPYWMPANGDIPLMGIPLDSIVKIEVIRGPGSVLYGTNASAGVINVITREGKLRNSISVSGNQDRNIVDVYLRKKYDDLSVNFGVSSRRDDGFTASVYDGNNLFDVTCGCFPDDLDGSYTRYYEYDSGLLNLTYKNFELSVQGHTLEAGRLPDGTVLSEGSMTERGIFVAAKYVIESDHVKTELFADWNRYYLESNASDINVLFGITGSGEISFENDGEDNDRQRVGLSASWKMDTRWALHVGAEHEQRSIEDYKFLRDDRSDILENFGFTLQPEDNSILLLNADSTDENSLYTQLSFDDSAWNGYLGIRYVDNEDFGSRINPSVALVYELDKKQSIKVLYSEGFNSPTFRQNSVVDNLGRPVENDVTAEVIRSFDVAYTYSSDFMHLVANIYHVEGEDLIVQHQGAFINAGSVKRDGIELDLQYDRKSWEILGAVSYIDQGNDEQDGPDYYVSKWLLDIGGVYRSGKHSIGSSLMYESKRAELDANSLLRLNYQYDVGSWQFDLSAHQSLTGEILQPDVRSLSARYKIEKVPKQDFETSIQFNF